MFGKFDLVDSLSRDIARARDKRDTLASDVTTLSSRIAELEARLSAESDRRERERAASEIEGIKKRVRDHYLALAPVIAGIRDATEKAAAIVPEAREFNDSLTMIAAEVTKAIDGLLGDLDLRIEALRLVQAAPELPQSLNGSPEVLRLVHAGREQSLIGSPEVLQNSDDVPCLPGWLPRRTTKTESIEDRYCPTAA
jgi:outer membrane murein-binding lipoprotein Lpp